MKKYLTKFAKPAFTMLELVFVIVVIGILAATIIPNTRTNPLQEAGIQILSHIRYTQHLALVNDTYNPNRIDTSGAVIWHKDRWQLVFSNSQFTGNTLAYTIFSDKEGNAVNRGDAQASEIAKDPQNADRILTGGYGNAAAIDFRDAGFKGNKKMNLGYSYGIASVTFEGGCANSGARISFDYMGRPLKGDHNSMTGPYTNSRLITTNCRLRFTDNTNESLYITIAPETGYACISDNASNCL